MPTFQFFKDGVEVEADRVRGANEAAIVASLNKHK